MTSIGETMASVPGCVVSTNRGLTHSSDFTREGLTVQPTDTCSVPNCTRRARGRGSICGTHYSRLRRQGSLADPKRPTAEERFLARVDRRSPSECWPWLGYKTRDGYGRFSAHRKKPLQAHRFAYEMFVGPIDAGVQIDHVWASGCMRRDCVNPSHLEAVSPHENWKRSRCQSRVNQLKTHCKSGHEFTAENTYIKKDGRACRKCHTRRVSEYQARKRAAKNGDAL